jgi:adenylosuccinate synthase
MINQALEHARGAGRHGSCGVGFGETVERSQCPDFALRGADLINEDHVRERLQIIRQEYVPRRLEQVGLPSDALDAWLDNAALIDRFLADALFLGRRLEWCEPLVLASQDALVFEGAQGLRLDQDLGEFPYVTRSHTGLPGIASMAHEAMLCGACPLEVHYVTRAYATRHGAGPLPDELAAAPAPGFSDITNVPNPYQGTLRFACLDPGTLRKDIRCDQERILDSGGVRARETPSRFAPGEDETLVVHPVLEVTCLDQMGTHTQWRDGTSWATPDLAFATAEAIGIPLVAEAWGPTRADRRGVAISARYQEAILQKNHPCHADMMS